MKRLIIVAACSFTFFLVNPVAQAGIYDFKGGIRIPAGSCVTYLSTPKDRTMSHSGALSAFNFDGRIDISCVCQLPVPEKALIRQFVMVGNVNNGSIEAEIGAVSWNVPRQHIQYAHVKMLPETSYEIPEMKQKKVVQNLPISGKNSLRTDRAQTYFIQARFVSNNAISIEEALSIFYFEVYWD